MNRNLPCRLQLAAIIAAAAAALGGCSTQQQPPSATQPPQATPAPTEPPASVPSAPATPPQADASKLPPPRTPLDAYKREVARRILDASATRTFDGIPPHFLRSVVVLELSVDRGGALQRVRLLRGNGHRDLEVAAQESVKRAAPFPAPPAGILRGATLEFTETWLFRDDGRFQIRSVAQPQQSASAQ